MSQLKFSQVHTALSYPPTYHGCLSLPLTTLSLNSGVGCGMTAPASG